jgi:hypothetical protein
MGSLDRVFVVGDFEEQMLKSRSDRGHGAMSGVPDLRSQWESLLDQVWRSEAEWRLWDRLDAAVRIETLREERANRLGKDRERDLL